ncbi:MAG: ATPase, T2SS/T4P/T4SS family [Pseudomonadota bacterium]
MAITESNLISAGLQAGLLSNDQLAEMRLQARRERVRLLEVVTTSGRFPVVALYQAYASLRNLAFLETKDLIPDEELVKRIPSGLMQRRNFLPVRTRGGESFLAMADPDDHVALDTARRFFRDQSKPALADPQSLTLTIAELFGANAEESRDTVAAVDSVALLDEILHAAYLYRASDIHFEPLTNGLRVRLRVDGQMQEYRRRFNEVERDGMTTRIKVLAGMDITEQRVNQDGGFSYDLSGRDGGNTDMRVATVPTRWGERITLRILGQESQHLNLEALGMGGAVLTDFRSAIQKPHGIVLVTGPTGSGKSTSLYAGLRELDSDSLNVLTVEDPIEQIIPGITQVQVTPKLGFANTLRSFLRHDPDVLLVGEIRDGETADTALRAALTGHLVMSTLHTNDSVGAIARLIDIGCEPYLISATLVGVMAQRLVRRLCPACREPRAATADECAELEVPLDTGQQIYGPTGCPLCLGSGYQGRVGLFEAFWVTPNIAASIAQGVDEPTLRAQIGAYQTFWDDATAKVFAGDTSLAEVHRIGIRKP